MWDTRKGSSASGVTPTLETPAGLDLHPYPWACKDAFPQGVVLNASASGTCGGVFRLLFQEHLLSSPCSSIWCKHSGDPVAEL